MNQPVFDFFNTPQNYLHKDFGVRLRAEFVFELVGKVNDFSILDVGCGDGRVTLQFLPDNRVTFLDISDKMLELTKSNTPAEFEPLTQRVKSDLQSFHGTQYDCIVALGLLAHVPSVTDSLRKLREMLKPNGLLIIQFSNYDSLLTKLRIKMDRRRGYAVNQIRYHDLEKLLAENELKKVDEIQYAFLLPGMGSLPNRLLYNYTRLTRPLGIGTDFIWALRGNRH